MKRKKNLLWVLLFASGSLTSCFKASHPWEDLQKEARRQGPQIIEQYHQDARAVRMEFRSIHYNMVTHEWSMRVRINWDAPVAHHHYWAEGWLIRNKPYDPFVWREEKRSLNLDAK